jgi:uncharacterized protein (TIGR04222 family)
MIVHGANPLDWSAAAYLAFHACALVAALLLGSAIQRALRPEGRRSPVDDPEVLAMLKGGAAVLGNAVAARLLADGRMTFDGRSRLTPVRGASAETAAERALLSERSGLRASLLTRAIKGPAESIAARMRRSGLWMDQDEMRTIRIAQTAPLACLLVFGLARWWLGEQRGEAVGFLIALEAVTALALLVRFFILDRATQAGRSALVDARRRYERLRRAPREPEMGLAVALFGPAVLAGTTLDPFHRMLNSSSGDGGGSDGGSSDGGGSGGCGGGGCGGCGG